MNSKKAFYIMAGSVSFMALLVIGAVVLGDKILTQQAQKLVSLRADAEVIERQQQALVIAKQDLEKYDELGAIAKQVVPQDKDQARAAREIVSIAEKSGVRIASLSFPSSTLGQITPKATAPTPEAGSTAPKPAVNPLTQATAVKDIPGLYQLAINITSDSSRPTTYTRLIAFLTRLEQNRRTAQVSQISIQPDSKDRNNLNFTLTVTLYIKP